MSPTITSHDTARELARASSNSHLEADRKFLGKAPTFNGEGNIFGYLEEFEDWSEGAGLQEDMKRRIFIRSLWDEARELI